MIQASAFDRLIVALYAAPTQPEMWSVFLKEFATVSGVSKAALLSHDFPENSHRMLAALGDSIKDRENIRLYETFYCQLDEWTVRFPRRGAIGRIVQGEEIWSKDALLKSTFYNEFLKRVDVCEVACGAADGSSCFLEGLSIYRGTGEDEFQPEQLAAFQFVLPHLKSALGIRRKLLELESRVCDVETALDCLNTALVLIDATAKVVIANRNARAILACCDGLVLERCRLNAQDPADGARLRAMLASAIAAGTGKRAPNAGAMRISRASKIALQISVGPLRAESLGLSERAVAVVFITDPDHRPAARPEMLRVLFDLTPAEIKLAALLLEGKSLSEVSERNCVGKETVRSQLKSIFLKTGTRRQSELIALLAGLPP